MQDERDLYRVQWPMLRTDAAFQRHYGCSPRTMRDRAARALQRLREAMSL